MHRFFKAAAILTSSAIVLAGCSNNDNKKTASTPTPSKPSESASANPSEGHAVKVVGNGKTVLLDTATIGAGKDSFTVSSTSPSTPSGGGSSITLWQPKSGSSVAKVFAGFKEEFAQGNLKLVAKGTRDLTKAATFYGLADVVPGYPHVITLNLKAGTYYLMDTGSQGNGLPKLTKLTVTTNGAAGTLKGNVTITTSKPGSKTDRYFAPATWSIASGGYYLFHNTSDTPHMMVMFPAKPGTTDAQVTKYFKANLQSAPPFALTGKAGAANGGADVISPGQTVQVSSNLPAGTYVIACFVGDDKTGMPHAAMGMSKVITITK